MKLRYFIIGLILALILSALIYELINESLVKTINRIQEHNHRLEEMSKLLY